MSFLSSLKRVTAAVSTGGLSLLTPKTTQEKIGSAVGVGTAIAAGGTVATSLLKGASLPTALSTGGAQAGSLLTTGSQLLGAGAQKLSGMLGLPSGVAPPATGGAPADTTGAMSIRGALNAQPNGALLVQGWPGGSGAMASPAVFNTMGGQAMPVMGALPEGAGAIARGAGVVGRWAGTLVGGALGLKAIKGLFTSAWGFVSRKKVVQIVKAIGIEAAAVALGVEVADIAHVMAAEATTKHRHRRGITSRQLAITNRTIRKVEGMHMRLSAAYHSSPGHCPPRYRRRKAA